MRAGFDFKFDGRTAALVAAKTAKFVPLNTRLSIPPSQPVLPPPFLPHSPPLPLSPRPACGCSQWIALRSHEAWQSLVSLFDQQSLRAHAVPADVACTRIRRAGFDGACQQHAHATYHAHSAPVLHTPMDSSISYAVVSAVALLNASHATLAFTVSTLGAIALVSLAAAITDSTTPHADSKFECALSAAACLASACVHYRTLATRRAALLAGYTDGANAAVDAQRYLGWTFSVGLLAMVSVLLGVDGVRDGFELLYAALCGFAAMLAAAAGWSVLLHAARRARGAYLLYGRICGTSIAESALLLVGVLLVVASIVAALVLQSRLHAASIDLQQWQQRTNRTRHDEDARNARSLQASLHHWASRGCVAYSCFSLVASMWIVLHMCGSVGARLCDATADAIACVLGLCCYARGRSQLLDAANAARMGEMDRLVAWQKPPNALASPALDEDGHNDAALAHLLLTALAPSPSASLEAFQASGAALATWRTLQRQLIVDTLSCLLDLVGLGGVAIGCSVLAFTRS